MLFVRSDNCVGTLDQADQLVLKKATTRSWVTYLTGIPRNMLLMSVITRLGSVSNVCYLAVVATVPVTPSLP